MNYLIQNARVIDPATKTDGVADILVRDGKIAGVGKDLREDGATVIDASGKIAAPGFIDLHTHLREPGREDKETVRSGTRAAVHGGFTSVCCMPNTDPAIDSPASARLVMDIASRDAVGTVFVIGAITRGRAGIELADLAGMRREGVVAVSDDGSSVEDAALMQHALAEAKKADMPVIAHCEDAKLSGKGVVNKGFISTKLGLRGIPREAEYERVKRDIALAAKAHARLHLAHVSCKESVELLRKAKKAGEEVTGETCPHYFALTDACCVTFDTNTKMNPPLRTAEDVQAIIAGLRDGTIDVIATDHAPHTDCEKDVEFDSAPFGIIGLETALSLSVMGLIETGILTWPELIAKFTQAPAGIIRVDRGTLRQGAVADIAIIDPAREWIYTKESVASKSRNSPFIGWKLKGRPTHVLARGALVVQESAVL